MDAVRWLPVSPEVGRSQAAPDADAVPGWFQPGAVVLSSPNGAIIGGVSMECETHRDLRQAYSEAVEALRLLLLAQGDAAGRPDEPQVFSAVHERVVYQQAKGDSLLKALKAHVSRHGCVQNAAGKAAASR